MAEEDVDLTPAIEPYLDPYLKNKVQVQEERRSSVRGEAPTENTTKLTPVENFSKKGKRSELESLHRELLARPSRIDHISWSKICVTNYEADSRARQVRLRSYQDHLNLADAESEARLKCLDINSSVIKSLFFDD